MLARAGLASLKGPWALRCARLLGRNVAGECLPSMTKGRQDVGGQRTQHLGTDRRVPGVSWRRQTGMFPRRPLPARGWHARARGGGPVSKGKARGSRPDLVPTVR